MNATTANPAVATPTAQTPGISRLVRRIHMFTGLFLAPWMVMYALSTLVMAHHESVNSFYGSKSPAMVKERELDYSRSFPTNLTRDAIAQQILNDIGMDGAHSVSGGRDGRPLVIQRQHATPQRRLTYDRQPAKSPSNVKNCARQRFWNACIGAAATVNLTGSKTRGASRSMSPSSQWSFGVSPEFGWRGNSRRLAFGASCRSWLAWDCSLPLLL